MSLPSYQSRIIILKNNNNNNNNIIIIIIIIIIIVVVCSLEWFHLTRQYNTKHYYALILMSSLVYL